MAVTYKDAGVDTSAGQDFVSRIKEYARATHGPEVISGIGGFAALFSPQWQKYKQPVLVSGTDGVGTKLAIAQKMGIHTTIGQDLVAMCLNDILTIGARPLFFLDYLVTHKLRPEVHSQVIQGIAKACRESGLALIGGETAEHPAADAHKDTAGEIDYDLAGFAVGIVDKKNILPKTNIAPGDVIWALPSSGLHSNGFSLVRKIIARNNLDLEKNYGLRQSLGETLLEPTRLYHDSLPDLAEKAQIKAAAHITGGGFYENIPRILPANCAAEISVAHIPEQPIFSFLQDQGPVDIDEMYKTFNMGIGMVLISEEKSMQDIEKTYKDVVRLGTVQKRSENMLPLVIQDL